MLTVNVYIIVIYDVITVDYCKCILLYSPLNSYLYVHWVSDFKYIFLLFFLLLLPIYLPGSLNFGGVVYAKNHFPVELV